MIVIRLGNKLGLREREREREKERERERKRVTSLLVLLPNPFS